MADPVFSKNNPNVLKINYILKVQKTFIFAVGIQILHCALLDSTSTTIWKLLPCAKFSIIRETKMQPIAK